MNQSTGRLPLAPLYIWAGLVAGIGVVGVLIGATVVLTDGVDTVGWALVLGGIVNMAAGGTEAFQRDPDEYEPGPQQLLVVGLSAIVGLFALFWLVVGR